MLTAGNILNWVGALCFACAILGCVYLIFAAALILRFRSREHPCKERRDPPAVPVTILVPLCGAEPGLKRRLIALCEQDYKGLVQIVCGTLDPADPAIGVIYEIAAEHHRHPIDCHADTRVHGQNLKISNLVNIAGYARHDTFILIDSDIEVGPDHVSKMVIELQKPGVGAVTCLYHGLSENGLWAQLAAMRINSDFLPSVIVGLATNLAKPCFGASIAITREMLRHFGGFIAFADQLWDDYALGMATREAGYEVTVSPFAVGHIYNYSSVREWLTHEFRAACTIRNIDPMGHAGSIIIYPLPLALIAAALGGGSQAIALSFIALACRVAVWRCVEYRFNTHASAMLLLPLRDVISFIVYCASFFGTTVVWRGQRYRLPGRTVVADQR